MLSKILAVAIDVLDADRGAIFLYDPAADELCARHADGSAGASCGLILASAWSAPPFALNRIPGGAG